MQGAHRPEDKRVMARVALNALVDPQRYPVDLSEIKGLKIEARLLVRAFLAYMATNANEYGTWDAVRCDVFYEALGTTEDATAASLGQTETSACM